MEIKSGIYCIENIVNGKRYIGSSIDVYKRRNRHFSELKRNLHKNKKLQSSYNKHGKEMFKFYVLELIEIKEKLIEQEQYYIDNLKPEYNINLIANSSLGVKRSEETKEKVRQANLGLKHPEWRNKLKSESQGGDKHWTKNKSFSEESKEKMSESKKELYKNGYISPKSKKIIELDEFGLIINEWDSAAKCGKFYGVTYKTITNIIDGKVKNSKTLGDKIFRYGE